MITPRTANNDSGNFDIKGPTLQGDPMDILSSKDRIAAPELAAIEQKRDNLAADLRDESPVPVVENERLIKPVDSEMTMSLLNIPEEPTSEHLAQAKVLNQWHELADRDAVKEIVVFEEVRTELPQSNNENLSLLESPAAFNVVSAKKEEPVVIDTKTEIKILAKDIARDLKARRTDSALEKITLMKALDPSHDYAVNGESYVALMSGN